jgi:hypothetical protein
MILSLAGYCDEQLGQCAIHSRLEDSDCTEGSAVERYESGPADQKYGRTHLGEVYSRGEPRLDAGRDLEELQLAAVRTAVNSDYEPTHGVFVAEGDIA